MRNLRAPKFWDKKNFLSNILLPISAIYFFLFLVKKFKQLICKNKFKIKIVCIGNINVGGTGKTPLTKLTYDILSKKYKCCTIKKDRAEHIDEINFLKDNTKLFLHQDRANAIKTAENEDCEFAILDDGLQDFSFEKDLNILCVKSNKGFGNKRLLPSGPLREPLTKIKKCDVAVINGEKNTNLENEIKKIKPDIHILQSKYEVKNLENYIDKKFLAFSGIADNSSFFDLLKNNDIPVCFTREFPDHHKFTQNEIKNLMYLANRENAKLLTTEKNFYSLSTDLRKAVQDIELKLIIPNYESFINEIY
jgi:tetraacyldisaccharide 4'-kinase